MDLNNLKKEELLKIIEEAEVQIKFIDKLKSEIKSSRKKNTLSGLKKNGDKIFCIDFHGSKIYHMDYVKIYFGQEDYGWFAFSTEHDTKPMGCSSSLRKECMNNYYFLSEFCGSMHFFTLKPENWKVDLKSELDRLVISKRAYFEDEIKIFENSINDLIESDEVDNFLVNIINN